MSLNINNTRVTNYLPLDSISKVRNEVPINESAIDNILKGRQELMDILDEKDNRFVVITGPCSIHDLKSAQEYADKLTHLQKKYSNKLLILMRVYFEKPRTSIGWKGMINDPHLNDSNNLNKGIKIARKLLIDFAEKGIFTATELLDPIIAAYIGELVSWVAIGARTTESQTHRQMSSGLSAPIGFKNSTDGKVDNAINAMLASKSPHSFLSINDDGISSIVETTGNPYGHIILRGGGGKPNHHIENIKEVEEKLNQKGFKKKIMVDCSHENSGKDYRKQSLVIQDILAQKKIGNRSIFGVMLESHLYEGNQKITANKEDLKYGVSITDQCIGWEETEKLLNIIYLEI